MSHVEAAQEGNWAEVKRTDRLNEISIFDVIQAFRAMVLALAHSSARLMGILISTQMPRPVKP